MAFFLAALAVNQQPLSLHFLNWQTPTVSVFWWLLPMSIPVLITQTKKLKAHNKARHERRCQYAPRP